MVASPPHAFLSTILRNKREEKKMTQKQVTDKLSIYIPQSKMAQKPVERLMKLSEKKDRSINYLVVEAILE
jgi:transcriptional regulator with XRE-family HTH domain